MNTRSAKKFVKRRSFFELPIFNLFALWLLGQCALTTGEIFVDNASEKSIRVRPEQTLLELFAKSFDPKDGIVSADCQRDTDLYRTALLNYEPWALKLYDSSAKIPVGVITSNHHDLGNYDECVKVRSDDGFVGKACRPVVRFSLTSSDDDDDDVDETGIRRLLMNLVVASGSKNWTVGQSISYDWLWCVPSSCTPDDVAATIVAGLDPIRNPTQVQFNVTVGDDSCHTEKSDRAVFGLAHWIYLFVAGVMIMIVIASTAYDLVSQQNPAKPDLKDTKHRMLTCFSAHANFKRLLDVRRGSDSIDCLDGLRFFGMCWVIHTHTTFTELDQAMLNYNDVKTMYKRWDTLIFLNNNIATDIFFLLSGTLLAYSEVGRKEKNPEGYRFKFWNLYVHRYLRLTPSYAMIVGFSALLLPNSGSGPHWNDFAGETSSRCLKNWWTNVLYVNNYVNFRSICMTQSWYLAVDMQLVWLSPLLLYPMLANGKNKQRIFLVLLGIAFVASILAPFLITYHQRLPATMLFFKDPDETVSAYVQIYIKVYARAGSYLVGLGLGYFLRFAKQKKMTLNKSVAIGGWIIATTAGLAVVFVPRRFYFSDYEYDVIEASFYAGLHRPVFALAVGWIVVAAVFGWAGPVGALLSWNVWMPFSKLTYSAYLIHYVILHWNIGSARTPLYYSTFGTVNAFFGTLVLTMFIAVVPFICVEMPFCRLDGMLIAGGRRRIPTFAGHNRATRDSEKNKTATTENRDNSMDRSTEVRMDDLRNFSDYELAGPSDFKDAHRITGSDNPGFEKTN